MTRRADLSTPRERRRLGVHYDPDAFGQFSESIARYLGTARFLVYQTGVIVAWVGLNLLPPADWQFDPWGRGLVLLTLVLSLQASYAAPLILLARTARSSATAPRPRPTAAWRSATRPTPSSSPARSPVCACRWPTCPPPATWKISWTGSPTPWRR